MDGGQRPHSSRPDQPHLVPKSHGYTFLESSENGWAYLSDQLGLGVACLPASQPPFKNVRILAARLERKLTRAPREGDP